ncbi:MAG TPA: septum formation initiator family protein [Pseudonocardiaceae bacterium]|nr:septum formation initiator family protein [Pseudonocardiaceae bacterium]
MTGREQERRRRRGEPSGGSPSRRTDRVRSRPADRLIATGSAEPSDEAADEYVRRATRGRGGPRPARRAWAGRVFGPVLGKLTTRRAALLALVVCGLALSIAVPLHTYLSQRDDLQAQLRQQQVLRAQRSQLEKREQQLSDPAQVEAEARTRLHFVLPGETPYVVQLPGNAPTPGTTHGTKKQPSTSWYQTLWNSIVGTPG